ncbi:MAG: GntR family transcriptional regulator [Armatimonadota bacterium]|nr:GntR family transcriptional regulator [bacterium]
MSPAKKQTNKKDEVRRKILDMLQTGQYKPGDRFLSETKLVTLMGCCRSTVREAIGLLISEGQLTHAQGSGTYVASNKKRRYTIAALFPDIHKEDADKCTINIVPPMVSAVIAEARLHNADVIVNTCGFDHREIERENIKNAIDRRVDAVIIQYMGEHYNLDVLDELRKSGIPVVFIDRYAGIANPDYAVTDNFAGTYDAVSAIAELGVDNIYFVSNIDQVTSVKDRMLGYTAAVNSFGLSCNVVYSRIELILGKDYLTVDTNSGEYMCLLKTFDGIKLPAAVFSVNPIINAVVHSVIENLEIPNDQIILGHFDPTSPMKGTTDRCYFEVDQPFAEMGTKAVQIAMAKINGNTELQQIVLKPKLTIHNLSSFATARSGMLEVSEEGVGNK